MSKRDALSLAAVFLVIVLAASFDSKFAPQAVELEAATGDLAGYAWSDTVGWISMNCATGGPTGNNICASANYKVTINADRTISGYAWSDAVGWIQFGGLSGFPGSGGNAAVNAAGTEVTGWARTVAETVETTPGPGNIPVSEGFGIPTTGTSWVVPEGVTSITVKAWGAGGAGGVSPEDLQGGTGGGGGFVRSTIAVTPGETLTLYVGGGGKVQGYYSLIKLSGGGGGGWTGIYRGSTPLAIAGGGGGGGATGENSTSHGGNGGASNQNGGTDSDGTGGRGGFAGNGGVGGAGGSGTTGTDGEAGGSRNGGRGGGVSAVGGGGEGGINGGGEGGLGERGTSSRGGGGGGGGGYGAGGGGEFGYSSQGGGGGGGGDNYVTGTNTSDLNGSGRTAANTADAAYPGQAGSGGDRYDDGADGYLHLSYTPATPEVRRVFASPTDGIDFVVPNGITSITVKAWGAGGGGSSFDVGSTNGGPGGGGGFARATLAVTPGETLSIRVGGGGEYGMAWHTTVGEAAGGGGWSGVVRGTTPLLIAAGGGGAAGITDTAAAPAGGASGSAGGNLSTTAIGGGAGSGGAGGAGGAGGSASPDGEAGSVDGLYEGGDGANGGTPAVLQVPVGKGGVNGGGTGGLLGNSNSPGGGGGGGGYGGGGGGEGGTSSHGGGGGGGGDNRVTGTATSDINGSGRNVANSADADYPGNVGNGGTGGFYSGYIQGTSGENGYVVITHGTPSPPPGGTTTVTPVDWISLNCINTNNCATSNYKVSVGLGVLTGYAWGGDTLGWINFYNVGFTQQCTPVYTCTDTQTSRHTDQWCAVTTTTCGAGQACSATTGQCVSAPPPTGAITFASERVASGETVQISWSTTDTISCTLTGSNGDSWSGGSTGGPVTSSPITGATTFTLRCTDLAGNQKIIDVETISTTPQVREI